ncbi:MAG: DUF2911 domain-containing protein [Agriterribacter sp.]
MGRCKSIIAHQFLNNTIQMNHSWGKPAFFIVLFCYICSVSCDGNSQSHNVPADTSSHFPAPRQEAANPASTLDKSPLDVIYFPQEYPKLKMIDSVTTPPVFRIFYSRPQRSGRKIFGGVVKFGEHWRLGANEATEIEFFEDVTIQKTKVRKGRYILYCIPQPTEWTLIINSDLYSWGLKIDTKKDIFKFTVPIVVTNKPIEDFTMETEKTSKGANLWIGWDDTKVVLPIDINE